jgi:hypothetical protein
MKTAQLHHQLTASDFFNLALGTPENKSFIMLHGLAVSPRALRFSTPDFTGLKPMKLRGQTASKISILTQLDNV